MTPQNRGQQELCALDASVSEIALAVGAARSTAHGWLSGKRLPGEEHRELISAAFGIDAASWDYIPRPGIEVTITPRKGGRPRSPQSPRKRSGRPRTASRRQGPARSTTAGPATAPTSPAAPPYSPRPAPDASPVTHQEWQLACIRHDIDHSKPSPPAMSKLRGSEITGMLNLERLRFEADLVDPRALRDHPAWRDFIARLRPPLQLHTDALRAVDAVLDDFANQCDIFERNEP